LILRRQKVKAFRCQQANIIEAKVLSHSEKPEEFRQLIEDATADMPNRRRIELFARRTTPGWDTWGNEVGKLDARQRLDARQQTISWG